MKQIITTTLFVLFILFSFNSFGQFGMKNDPEDIAQVKKRTLIVGIRAENPKLIKKYSKKKDKSILKDYKTEIKEYNANIKAAVSKFWKTSPKVEYKTYEQIMALRKAKKLSKYAILEHDVITMYAGTIGVFAHKVGTKSSLGISLGHKKKVKYVTTAPMPTVIASKEDFAYALMLIQHSLNDYEEDKKRKEMKNDIKERSLQLENVTLLLDKALLDKKLTEAKVKAVYPYKFEFVDADRIKQAIWNQEKGVSYLQVIPLGTASMGGGSSTGGLVGLAMRAGAHKMLYGQMVMNAETGETIAYSMPKVGTVFTKSRKDIDEKTISEIFNLSNDEKQKQVEEGK